MLYWLVSTCHNKQGDGKGGGGGGLNLHAQHFNKRNKVTLTGGGGAKSQPAGGAERSGVNPQSPLAVAGRSRADGRTAPQDKRAEPGRRAASHVRLDVGEGVSERRGERRAGVRRRRRRGRRAHLAGEQLLIGPLPLQELRRRQLGVGQQPVNQGQLSLPVLQVAAQREERRALVTITEFSSSSSSIL